MPIYTKIGRLRRRIKQNARQRVLPRRFVLLFFPSYDIIAGRPACTSDDKTKASERYISLSNLCFSEIEKMSKTARRRYAALYAVGVVRNKNKVMNIKCAVCSGLLSRSLPPAVFCIGGNVLRRLFARKKRRQA